MTTKMLFYVYDFSLTCVSFANITGLGFMNYTEPNHHGAIIKSWLPFLEALILILGILIEQTDQLVTYFKITIWKDTNCVLSLHFFH